MAKTLSILVVDDDADVLKAAAMALAGEGARVATQASPEGLIAAARGCDVVLLDMNFAAGARKSPYSVGIATSMNSGLRNAGMTSAKATAMTPASCLRAP